MSSQSRIDIAGKPSLSPPVSLSAVDCTPADHVSVTGDHAVCHCHPLRPYPRQPTTQAARALARVCDARSPEITGHVLVAGQPARLLRCGKGRAVGPTAHARERRARTQACEEAVTGRVHSRHLPWRPCRTPRPIAPSVNSQLHTA